MIFISGLFHCFTQLCLRLHFWQSLRCSIVLGRFGSITARFFGVPAARFHLFSFFCCFMNKYDSISLKCLFLSTSPIASSRVCWGVYNCLENDTFASVFVLYVHKPCLVGLVAEINKTVKLSAVKQAKFVCNQTQNY